MRVEIAEEIPAELSDEDLPEMEASHIDPFTGMNDMEEAELAFAEPAMADARGRKGAAPDPDNSGDTILNSKQLLRRHGQRNAPQHFSWSSSPCSFYEDDVSSGATPNKRMSSSSKLPNFSNAPRGSV